MKEGLDPRWVCAWTASAQGPYPVGNPSAQPELRFAFPDPAAGARDQAFRLILRPSLWGPRARFRFSNAFGEKPLQLDGACVGLQLFGSALAPGSVRRMTFSGERGALVPPGGQVWSDPVALPSADDPSALFGRKLAVSFFVSGESGPMTWHAKALTTSYVSAPASPARIDDESGAEFPFGTTSWYFLDAVDMEAPADTGAIVCFGDSITDGSCSTLNGDDRWPDVFSLRLRARFGDRFAVANAGIGGNRVTSPAEYSPAEPYAGGPSALSRLERDVLSLSGVERIVWLEGINDFSDKCGASAAQVCDGFRAGVARMRASLPGARIFGAAVTPALGSSIEGHGSAEQDEKRRVVNGFIRDSGLFDAVLDFAAAVTDPATGRLRPEFVPDSTVGGPGDGLHPNRLGYLAMASSIDLDLFA